MATIEQVRAWLSDIEPTEATFASITAADVPHLVALLADEEEWLASRAVHALSRIDAPAARDALARATEDTRPAVRVSAAASLQRLPRDAADPLLLRALRDDDPGVRRYALASVSPLSSAAVRASVELLARDDPHALIRSRAADVRGRFR